MAATATGGADVTLSDELLTFIDTWKEKPGNLIMVLHRIQEEYGYIPRDVALKLTELLDVPLAKIYGVVTFYHFFKLEKPGDNIISVCMGTACYLNGAQDLLDELKKLLGVELDEPTDDGKFSIEAVRCIGCCGLAPVVSVNGEVYGKLTKDDLPDVLAKY
jgi:NADH-quinone oxidoreductase subunit E